MKTPILGWNLGTLEAFQLMLIGLWLGGKLDRPLWLVLLPGFIWVGCWLLFLLGAVIWAAVELGRKAGKNREKRAHDAMVGSTTADLYSGPTKLGGPGSRTYH